MKPRSTAPDRVGRPWRAFMGMALGAGAVLSAAEGDAPQGTMPFSSQPDTHQRSEERLFPLLRTTLVPAERGRELPPPFGVMYVANWMDSDWTFTSASVSLAGSPYIGLDAADGATMDLKSRTNGAKADLWILPFMDLMVGFGRADIDATLGLRDIPIHYDAGLGGGTVVRGDAIIPMSFSGEYYSIGTVLAVAYDRLYVAADLSFVKTRLGGGDASLSADGFWTFTAAPKIGYNAGMSQIYVGARYLSKNEHYVGQVHLPSGQQLAFDVEVATASWVGNFGMRTVLRDHWEILMESALGNRQQITAGLGYRW